MTHIVLPDVDSPEISDFINGSFFIFKLVGSCLAYNYYMPFKYYDHVQCLLLDCGQQLEHPSTSQAPPEDTRSIDTSEIEKVFLATAYQLVSKILNELDVTTLKEPERCATLELTATSLPGNFASIFKIKTMLDKLIAIYKQLQLGYSEFEVDTQDKRISFPFFLKGE